MKSYNYKINNQSLHEIIDFNLFKNEKNLLIQVFCGKNEITYKSTINVLLKELPTAICIGASTNGEISNDKISVGHIVISISVFKNTKILSAYSQKKSCFEKGSDLAKQLVSKNTKVIILFADIQCTNSEVLLKGIQSINKNIVISGGIVSNNQKGESCFLSSQNKILNEGVVGISLNSDILSVQNDFRFNWSSIGIEHTITKSHRNIVSEINGMNTLEFYKKYLGDDIRDELAKKVSSFPLLINDNNITTARTVIEVLEDGSFKFTGNLKENKKVIFGFGNAEMLLKDPIIPLDRDYSKVESFFIYSSNARRKYIPDLIHIENSAYSNIANTSGAFLSGEFFYQNNQAQLFNNSFTSIALSEIVNERIETTSNISSKNQTIKNKAQNSMQTLTHLIEQSAKDYHMQSINLENEKINSQLLVASQKIFLRHAIHETNTPISVIMSNIELFEMEHGSNQYLSNIEVALKNIFNIYDDLSYLIKKDQIDYPKREIDFVDYIRARTEFFTLSAIQVGSRFVFHSTFKELFINFNETKLQRIIDNNLTNAIKYTAENSNIYITLKKEDGFCALIISSCSEYIQFPEKIFKEYYREETTKEGFGLGLSLVKKICTEEDIDISIESNEYFTSFKYLFKMERK
jgi:signal transduction histidine kinase